MLRRVANLGQIIQSHALSFFHLSSPDMLLGFDHDPATRNVFGLMSAEPESGADGASGSAASGRVSSRPSPGRKVHAPGIVPGGIANPMTPETRDRLLAGLVEAKQTAEDALGIFISMLGKFEREMNNFGLFPSLHLGLANDAGTWENYDGHLKFVDAEGNVVADNIDPADYRRYIGEATRRDSYLKSPYFKPLVPPGEDVNKGIYRVGPLARLNVCKTMGAPMADEALKEYRERAGGTANSSFFYHYARLIEILASTELMRNVPPRRCHPRPDGASHRRDQPSSRGRRVRGATWDAIPRLPGRRPRAAGEREHDHRHRPEQSADERDRSSRSPRNGSTALRSPSRCSIASRPGSGRSTRVSAARRTHSVRCLSM